MSTKSDDFIKGLKKKATWVRKETLKIHRMAQETRIASSLSPVELFVALYYGKILNYDPKNITWEGRDRFVISKGHGSISLYPILADLGYFDKQELNNVCKKGSILGGIPDPIIPGYESINGSLGHGLGVGLGMALAIKRKGRNEKVFVLLGDGELYEGSIWEAVMLAGEHKVDNLIAIIDRNQACMLDLCKNVIDLEPLDEKFAVHGWETARIDGHDAGMVYKTLVDLKENKNNKPKMLIMDTVKGKCVPSLEVDPLSHIRSLKEEEIDMIIEGLL